MKGFYVSGSRGSYVELEDGRVADSVADAQADAQVLADELTAAQPEPLFSELSASAIAQYVGA